MELSLKAANAAVQRRKREEARFGDMGTTLVAAAVTADGLDWISVGDSPLYHFESREGTLRQLNQRHNAPGRPNQLTAAVMGEGLAETSRAERPQALREGDVVIAASDGLDTLQAGEIALLAGNREGAIAKALVDEALARANARQDNVTVAAMRIGTSRQSVRRPMIEAVRADGEAHVYVEGRPLDWSRSLSLWNHSPSAVEWGYGGSGPAQLALALLLEVSGDRRIAVRGHQKFKWDLIAGARRAGWRLPVATVHAWIDAHRDELAA